ncbi:unnamed protein product, partial [marine sediment metagenome]
QSGESYWVGGLVNVTEQWAKRKQINQFFHQKVFDYSLSEDIETEMRRFYQYNPNLSLIKSPPMTWSYGAFSRYANDPKPFIVFRNPLERLRHNEARIKEIDEDRGFWITQNACFLTIKAPVIEFTYDLKIMKKQMQRALAFYKMEFNEQVFEENYVVSRRFNINWDTNISLLGPNYRRVYDALVNRAKDGV